MHHTPFSHPCITPPFFSQVEVFGPDLGVGSGTDGSGSDGWRYECRFEPLDERGDAGSGDAGSGSGALGEEETGANVSLVAAARLELGATAAGRLPPQPAVVCTAPPSLARVSSSSGKSQHPFFASVAPQFRQMSHRMFSMWHTPSCPYVTPHSEYPHESVSVSSHFVRAGSVAVSIALSGGQFFDSSSRLALYAQPTLTTSLPASGPADGGTHVRVFAPSLGAFDGSNYTCRFGNYAVVQGSYVSAAGRSSSHVRCVSPARSLRPTQLGERVPGAACAKSPSSGCAAAESLSEDLELAPNGNDYAPPIAFVRFTTPRLVEMGPSVGPIDGGTMVTVRGTSLAYGDGYSCRFERADASVIVGASYTVDGGGGGGFVRCESPPLGALNAALDADQPELDSDDADDSASASALDSGGTAQDAGSGASGSGASGSSAPSLSARFRLALNGQQYHSRHEGPPFLFSYYGQPTVSLLSPACGPTVGGTRVRVTGDGLLAGIGARCRFNASAIDGVEDVPVSASEMIISCVSPAADTAAASRWALSLNGQQFSALSSQLSFERYKPLVALSLSPASGPSDGGTLVAVALEPPGAPDVAAARVRCRFAGGAPDGVDAIDGIGTRIDPLTLMCVSPANVSAGSLEVSLNAQQFSSEGIQFERYVPPTLSRVQPEIATAEGGAHLSLYFESPSASLLAGTYSTGDAPSCRFNQSGQIFETIAQLTEAKVADRGASRESLTAPIAPICHTRIFPHRSHPILFDSAAEGSADAETSDAETSDAESSDAKPAETFACVSPSLALGEATVGLALNGQQISANTLPLSILPPPRVSVHFPGKPLTLTSCPSATHTYASYASAGFSSCAQFAASGAAGGGTVVTVSGTGLVPAAARRTQPRCRVGASLVAATVVNESMLACRIPTAAAAGAAATLEIDFEAHFYFSTQTTHFSHMSHTPFPHISEFNSFFEAHAGGADAAADFDGVLPALAAGVKLFGRAELVAGGGPLVLTRSHRDESGGFVVDPPPLPSHIDPPSSLRLSLVLSMGTGHPFPTPAGEGFSVSIGRLPDGLFDGARGGGDALRLAVLTRERLVRIAYGKQASLMQVSCKSRASLVQVAYAH